MISAAAVGLRGAGYVAFDGEPPENHRHEAIAAVYAHVTAPLRRLVDRYANEIVLSVQADSPVPEWVTARLEELPRAMATAAGRASALDRAVVDLVEAQILSGSVGRQFAATVVRVGEGGSNLQLRDPAVLARVPEQLPLGHDVLVRLDSVDVNSRTLRFTVLPDETG